MIAVLLFSLLVQTPDDAKRVLGLIDELKQSDAGVRRRAIEALLAAGEKAVPHALAVLADEFPGLEQRVDDLVAKLAAPEWAVRAEAQKALVAIGRRARPRLQKHANHENVEVNWRVRTALAEIAEDERDETARDYALKREICEFLGRSGDARAPAAVARVLQLRAPSVAAHAEDHLALRVRAVEALGRLARSLTTEQTEAAVEAATQAVTQARASRDAAALAVALGQFRTRAAVPPLLAMLRDRGRRDVHVKRLVMRSLVALDDPRGVAGVVQAVGADDVYVREAAIDTLAEATGKDVGLDPRRAPGSDAERVRALRAWWEKKYGLEWAGD
jgi:HEAT repeat protein